MRRPEQKLVKAGDTRDAKLHGGAALVDRRGEHDVKGRELAGAVLCAGFRDRGCRRGIRVKQLRLIVEPGDIQLDTQLHDGHHLREMPPEPHVEIGKILADSFPEGGEREAFAAGNFFEVVGNSWP